MPRHAAGSSMESGGLPPSSQSVRRSPTPVVTRPAARRDIHMAPTSPPRAQFSKERASPSPWPSKAECIIILCCAVDAVDKTLLPSCFRALQMDLGVSPTELGVLNLFQCMAFSLALPVWGWLTSVIPARDLLITGCTMWGVATGALALSLDFKTHCALRAINGMGLCGVMPISQAMLVEMVPEDRRGVAFGRLGAVSAASSMLAAWYAVTVQAEEFQVGFSTLHGWQVVHLQVAAASLAVAMLVSCRMPEGRVYSGAADGTLPVGGTRNAVWTIFRIPSFVLLVLQGVTGAVPWNAMSFINLYYSACGYTDAQAARLGMVGGIGGMCSNLLGGHLGDAAAKRFPARGRVMVALTSVLLGIPTFSSLFFLVPRDPAWFTAAATVAFCFSLTAGWTPAGANRPICAELVTSPTERAQTIAWWVMIEGISASLFGAPLVGWLSEKFGYRLGEEQDHAMPDASEALAKAMVGVAMVSWVTCACVWVAMGFTFPRDRAEARARAQLFKHEA